MIDVFLFINIIFHNNFSDFSTYSVLAIIEIVVLLAFTLIVLLLQDIFICYKVLVFCIFLCLFLFIVISCRWNAGLGKFAGQRPAVLPLCSAINSYSNMSQVR